MRIKTLISIKDIAVSLICVLITISTAIFQTAYADEAKRNEDSAGDLIAILKYKKVSFSPSRKESISIPIKVNKPEKVKKIIVEIKTSDNDLIRSISVNTDEKTNEYEIQWDGKDSQGEYVPNEAFHPVFTIVDRKNKLITLDSRKYSGGEEVYDFDKKIRPGAIEYQLPVPSRMLIRSGIKNGPMLRTIVDWEPRVEGFQVERWNGRDADNLIAIEQNNNVGYLIIGYKLPDYSIITYGNKKQSYREYRESKKWPIKQANYNERLLERNGKVLRQEFYTPVLQQKSPRIEASILNNKTRQKVSDVSNYDEVITKVNIHPLDEIYLDQERYEISFFIDNEFIAEEEQGFVPFSWRWSPGRHGIKPGKHILTINVSGYNGQVGVRNFAFTLKN